MFGFVLVVIEVVDEDLMYFFSFLFWVYVEFFVSMVF